MREDIAVNLTEAQRDLLALIAMRPNGAMIRSEEGKADVLVLAAKVFVCDPHTIGSALFTRITDAGRAALAQPVNETPKSKHVTSEAEGER